MIDWITWGLNSAISVLKEGAQLTTALIVLGGLLRIKWVQELFVKMIIKLLPKRLWPKHHTSNTEVLYELRELRQAMEESKWHADLSTGENEQSATTGALEKSLLQPEAYAPVTSTKYSTLQRGTYPSPQRRMNMKSKWLSRKFLMAVISAALVICNDGLNLGLDQSTIIAFGSIVVGWIAGEAVVDAKKTTTGGTTNDSTFTTPVESNE